MEEKQELFFKEKENGSVFPIEKDSREDHVLLWSLYVRYCVNISYLTRSYANAF